MLLRHWNKWSWLAALFATVMIGALWQYAYVESDTSSLLDNADGFLGCLRDGRWRTCEAAGKFAAFQLLLAAALRSVGISMDVGLFLARLSIVEYLGVLAITWRQLKRRSRLVAGTAVLVLVAGLPLHYANRSFGEMGAAFLTLAFVASWLEGKTTLVGFTALLAALSKETAFLLLAVLGIVCAIVRFSGARDAWELWHRERPRLTAMTIGIAVAVFLAIGLNLFRFGKPYNAVYLAEAAMGPSLKTQLHLFVALWLAPNAGLLFFWPMFVIVMLSIPFAVRHVASIRAGARTAFWSVLAFLTLVTAFHAWWWAPFGWWAWGQRLMLPWLPASLFILCFAYSVQLETSIVRLLRTPARAAWLTAIVIILALPHVASIFRSDELIASTFERHPSCGLPDTQQTHDRYYGCIEAIAWTGPWTLLHAYSLLLHPFVRLRALVYAGLLALGGAALYRESVSARSRAFVRSTQPPSAAGAPPPR